MKYLIRIFAVIFAIMVYVLWRQIDLDLWHSYIGISAFIRGVFIYFFLTTAWKKKNPVKKKQSMLMIAKKL